MSSLTKASQMRIFIVLLLGSCLSSFVHTALNTALTPIMQEFRITVDTAQWLISSYSLITGIMLLATPFLIHRFPCKPLYTVAMGLFCLGMLLAALSGSFPMLFIGRTLQAVGCGVLASLPQVVVLAIFPPESRGSMMGLYGLSICALPVLAPTVAGLIIDVSNWQMIFWSGLIVSLAVLAAGTIVMKNFTPTEKLRFETASMLFCSCGFAGIMLGVGNWGNYRLFSPQVLLPIMLGLLGLVIFTYKQNRSKNPFINLSVFLNADFCVATITSMLLYAGMMAATILIPLYMQSIRGFSATTSGLVTMPGSLLTAVFSVVSGRLYNRVGIRRLYLVGVSLLTIGSLACCFLTGSTSVAAVCIMYSFRGAGLGMLLMPIVTWGMSRIPGQYTADGTAIISSLRSIAGSVGAVVFVSLIGAVSGEADSAAMLVGMRVSFAGITLLAALIALLAVSKIGVSS